MTTNYFRDNLLKLIDIIQEDIDEEVKNMPISNEDAIRKSSKCYELGAVRYTLIDILENEPK